MDPQRPRTPNRPFSLAARCYWGESLEVNPSYESGGPAKNLMRNIITYVENRSECHPTARHIAFWILPLWFSWLFFLVTDIFSLGRGDSENRPRPGKMFFEIMRCGGFGKRIDQIHEYLGISTFHSGHFALLFIRWDWDFPSHFGHQWARSRDLPDNPVKMQITKCRNNCLDGV